MQDFDPKAITTDLYAAVSGPAGPRHWGKAGRLFHSDARLVRTGADAEGAIFRDVLTWADFVAHVDRRLANVAFYEEEEWQDSLRCGNVAEIRSLYRWRFPDEARTGRGWNFFTLVLFPEGWKVMSLVWDNERPGLAVPEPPRAEAVAR